VEANFLQYAPDSHERITEPVYAFPATNAGPRPTGTASDEHQSDPEQTRATLGSTDVDQLFATAKEAHWGLAFLWWRYTAWDDAMVPAPAEEIARL
jgi:hypothetical protein